MTTVRVIVVVSLVLATSARAEPPPSPQAQAHIDAGVSAFNAKDYATASSEFEAAYTLAPLPKLLFAWAQAQRLGGHCDDAIPLYRRYLATKPTAEQIEAATNGMLLCERAQTPPAPAPPVVAATPPVVPPLAIHEEPAPWYSDKVGDALVLGGVLSLAVGASFFVLAASSEEEAEAQPLRADFVAGLDEATLRRRIAWAGIGVGSGLLIGGFARYVFHRRERTNVEVTATRHSIGVSARF